MKNFFFTLLFFCAYYISGQTLTFNNINSDNVLELVTVSSLRLTENSSNTTVIQEGNNNNAMVYDKSKKSDLIIRQTGDFNTTLMNNTNPKLENNQKVNIEGFNNYIDITGNNGNSKDMQINLKTNDKMIFVRHY